MTAVDEHNRPEPPLEGNERETLTGFLDWQRATLAWKCSGLTDAQLCERPIPPSELSLLGLLRHMTDVEQQWFDRVLNGREVDPHYWSRDTGNGERIDTDFAVEGTDTATAITLWESQCEKSRVISASKPLEATGNHPRDPREAFSHRWILTHMIEEYARHNGHADLLREQIDGATGE